VTQQKTFVFKKQKKKFKAIQSYLYKKPKQTTVKITQKPQNIPINKPQSNVTNILKSDIKKTASSKTKNKVIINNQKVAIKNNLSSTQLENLRSSINKKIRAKEFAHISRPKGYSVMTDLPDAVKHSKKQLTREEKKRAMTTQYSGGLAITKNDNGSCSIAEDLSNVGMEGIVALSGFKCGQTKMEKMYDKHMDKVLEKLGKKKRR